MKKILQYFVISLFLSLSTFIAAKNNKFILHNGSGQTMYVALGINATNEEVINSTMTVIDHNSAFYNIVSLDDNIKFVIWPYGYIYSGAKVTIFEIDKSFLNSQTDSVVLRVTLINNNYVLTPLYSFNGIQYPNNITANEINQFVVNK